MITANMAEVRRHEHKLERLNSRGLLFAELETVNRAAVETQRAAKRDLPRRMTIRNTWTARTIIAQKAHRDRLEAKAGSTQGYMATQQNGAEIQANGSHGVDIATPSASGEGRAAVRKRMVRKRNRMSQISLTGKPNKALSRKARNAYAIRNAAAAGGTQYVFLDLQRRKGIFRVSGGKRSPRIEMMHDLSHRRIRIPRNPWLTDAAAGPTRELPRYYHAALIRQLRRL